MNVLGIVLGIALSPSPGHAGPASVQVTVAGAPTDGGALMEALPEFTRELGVPTRFERRDAIALEDIVSPAQAPSPAPAHVWIDLGDPSRARIIIIDGDYERVLIRTVVLPEGLDEVARDEIGYIVEASVEALLAGGQIGISRDVAAEELGVGPEPEPAKPPAKKRGPVAEVSVGYGARAWGPVAPLHGPLLDFGVGARFERVDLGGALELQYLVPTRVAGDPFSIRFTGASMRGLVRTDLHLGGQWSFDVAAGGGIDLLHDEGRAGASGAEAFDPRTRVVGDLALRLGPAVRLGPSDDRVLLRLDATMDVAVRSYRYITADTAEVAFDPWIARPGLRLTLGWSRTR